MHVTVDVDTVMLAQLYNSTVCFLVLFYCVFFFRADPLTFCVDRDWDVDLLGEDPACPEGGCNGGTCFRNACCCPEYTTGE